MPGWNVGSLVYHDWLECLRKTGGNSRLSNCVPKAMAGASLIPKRVPAGLELVRLDLAGGQNGKPLPEGGVWSAAREDCELGAGMLSAGSPAKSNLTSLSVYKTSETGKRHRWLACFGLSGGGRTKLTLRRAESLLGQQYKRFACGQPCNHPHR